MAQAGRRRADIRMAVVSVEAPGLQDAIDIAVLARPSDVIHQLVTPVFLDRASNAPADVGQRFVPADALPLSTAARTFTLEGIENAIGILELVRRDDALGARAAAAARMHGVAFDLADLERLLVDVGEDAARRLAVEADAGDDPVLAAILFGPALGLEVLVVVPLGWIGMGAKLGHEFGTD